MSPRRSYRRLISGSRECRCRPENGPSRGTPFPETTPPGLNHLVLTGALLGHPQQGTSPRGDSVTLLRLGFPVRDPERPEDLWTLASCEIEVPDALAGVTIPGLRVGASVLAAGQLSDREAAEDGSRRGVIVAAAVHPGASPSQLFISSASAVAREARRL